MMATTRSGLEARIDATTRVALVNQKMKIAPDGAIAWKHTDPTEEARWIFDETELAEIQRTDPGLVDLVGQIDDFC